MQDRLCGQSISPNILVYGFYGHKNLGDELFRDAFRIIFPDINFSFSDRITVDNIGTASAVFIGGGSFLSNHIDLTEECLNLLKAKKIFYIGVGAETDIHPSHQVLIRLAKLIALRSPAGLEKILELNANVVLIPDLVYVLHANRASSKIDKSVLVLPNIHAVPQNIDAHWKHNAWEHFKFEFSQFLDHLVENEYVVNFFSMCNNDKHNDDWAAYEIISNMKYRDGSNLVRTKDVFELFSKYEVVITQRFHGIILSEITRVPYIAIHHHDKLTQSYLNEGSFLSMYNTSKNSLIDQFNLVEKIKLSESLAIKLDIFKSLKEKVISILYEG